MDQDNTKESKVKTRVMGETHGRKTVVTPAESPPDEAVLVEVSPGHSRLEATLGPTHERILETAGRLADLYQARGRQNEAEVWRNRAR